MGEQIEKLAQFIARTGWDDMPEAVHRRAKLVRLTADGKAIVISGTNEQQAEQLEVLPLDGYKALAPFFDGFMVPA